MSTDQTMNTREKPDTAILFAGWGDTPLGQSNELIPLLGRSMLQRAVERLARSGCIRIHVALGESPLPVKSFLDDGTRWGCQVVCHTPAADESFSDFCLRLDLKPDQQYVLADASLMPPDQDCVPETTCDAGAACFWDDGETSRWTGWAVLQGALLLDLQIPIQHPELEKSLLNDDRIERQTMQMPLSSTSLAQLLDTHERLLALEPEAGIGGGAMRGTQIHQTARILPPVFIGRHVQIGAGATVGPFVSLGDGSLVDRDAYVEKSIVLPATYVGEGLELIGTVVSGNRLANIRLNTSIRVNDPNLLATTGNLPDLDRPGRSEKALALGLRIVLAPVRAWLAMRSKQTERDWLVSHFLDDFYPGLALVARGRLRMVGPARRSPSEISQLPRDWQELHANHPFGLLNEAALLEPAARTTEMRFASDALACAGQGQTPFMFRLVRNYLGQLASRLFGGRRNADKTEPGRQRATDSYR